ncbi:MAG: hypothetical protein QXJ97_08730 [Desulfurococcaceae archaeon]
MQRACGGAKRLQRHKRHSEKEGGSPERVSPVNWRSAGELVQKVTRGGKKVVKPEAGGLEAEVASRRSPTPLRSLPTTPYFAE